MIKLGELFCGPGGFAEGAKKAGGFKHVWANDIHPDSCKTFKKHHPDCEVFEGDVFKDFIKGEYKIISFFAKKARGMMARFIIKNRLMNPEQLAEFNFGGYQYSHEESTDLSPVFLRDNVN